MIEIIIIKSMRQNWVVKVINWELCKGFEFDHLISSIYTTQSPSRRMRPSMFSGIMRYKWSARQSDQEIVKKKKKKS